MRRCKIFGLLFYFLITTSCKEKCYGQELKIIENRTSEYNIVIRKNGTEIEKKAAKELQDYLKAISNVEIPISSSSSKNGKNIVVSNENKFISDFGVSIDGLGEDGYWIKTQNDNLILTGGSRKGLLYAVYSFLESYLGCRMLDRGVFVIPKKDNIIVKAINDKQIPVIQNRMVFYRQAIDELYRDWHKLDLYRDSKDSLWGNWAHSFISFIPPSKYFKTHPEYFALRGGKREATQLCLSNSDVFSIVSDELGKKIKQNPKAQYWSISQEDNTKNCQCDQCKALDNEEGSPSGSIVNFVNKVATKFPNKTIATLAYSYSQKPPKHIKPRRNVLIVFCTTGQFNRGIRYVGQSQAKNYIDNLQAWNRITNKLMVWDYIIDYKHFLMPFPNFSAMPVNLKDFVQNGATGVFMQGNYYGGGAFDELKCYLLAKLSWNPNADPSSIINEFLDGYYGPAAPFISEYLKTMNDNFLSSKEHLGIFDNPDDHIKGYLSIENLNTYYAMLDKAEGAVRNDTSYMKRVKNLRANVDYAYLTNELFKAPKVKGALRTLGSNKIAFSETSFGKLNNVVESLKGTRTSYISEGGVTPKQYEQKMLGVLNQPNTLFAPGNIALGKKITLTYKPTETHAKYAGNDALIDGIKGSLGLALDTWQGFYGGKFEAVIDLYKAYKVQSVTAAFLKGPLVNVQYPSQYQVYYSSDGVNFKKFAELSTKVNEKSATAETSVYTAKNKQISCRYIKVVASNSKKAPMLIDEIVVR